MEGEQDNNEKLLSEELLDDDLELESDIEDLPL
jgi:hypothetical protein